MSNRDYNDPIYVKARRDVRARDGNKCILCKSNKRVEVHHIARYADIKIHITRYMCCLCKRCHKKVTGFEEYYMGLLLKLVMRNIEKDKS